jgi:hypothetical protein
VINLFRMKVLLLFSSGAQEFQKGLWFQSCIRVN